MRLARAIGSALKRSGVGVRVWAGPSTQAEARAVGLDANSGRMLIDSLNREAELEEVSPEPEQRDLLPTATEVGILGGKRSHPRELTRRLAQGDHFIRATPEHRARRNRHRVDDRQPGSQGRESACLAMRALRSRALQIIQRVSWLGCVDGEPGFCIVVGLLG